MFQKMKLRTYLLSVFSLIIVLTALISLLGIIGLIKTKNNMNTLTGDYMAADTAVKICRIEANIAARNVREMALTSDISSYSSYQKKIAASIEKIKEQIEIFKKAHGEEDGLAVKYEEAFNQWFPIAIEAMECIIGGEQKEGVEILENKCIPALNSLAEIANEINTTTDNWKTTMEQKSGRELNGFLYGVICLFILIIIVCIFFAARVTKNISIALDRVKEGINEFSKGNLESDIKYQADNEFGLLAKDFKFCIQELKKYVEAVRFGMEEFSRGNLALECPVEFIGDFAAIEKAISVFAIKMSDTLLDVSNASGQVSAGAEQIASGSQVLSAGAEEQAGSVQELSAAIMDITEKITKTAETVKAIDNLVGDTGRMVENGNHKMKEMTKAMKDITDKSNQVKNIIDTINDITYKTNLLALNAAIEAARAGEAGKGFSVVADEVRKLACKSSEASKNIEALIEETIESVSYGADKAEETAAMLASIAEHAGVITGKVENVSGVVLQQAEGMKQISDSMDQISGVIQSNSATAQESAAASQELAAQAQILKELTEHFVLRE